MSERARATIDILVSHYFFPLSSSNTTSSHSPPPTRQHPILLSTTLPRDLQFECAQDVVALLRFAAQLHTLALGRCSRSRRGLTLSSYHIRLVVSWLLLRQRGKGERGVRESERRRGEEVGRGALSLCVRACEGARSRQRGDAGGGRTKQNEETC